MMTSNENKKNNVRITNDESGAYWLENNGYAYIVDSIENDMVRIDKQCQRCHGTGYWARNHWNQGGICFKCGGDGNKTTEYIGIKEYARMKKSEQTTQERKIRARKEKEAKKEEKLLDGQRNWCEKNGHGRITFDEKNKIEKAKREDEKKNSDYVGTIGKRVELTLELLHIAHWDNQWGVTFVFIMQDENGNKVTWRTSSNWDFAEVGTVRNVMATVKEHSTYKNEKQTVVTRVKEIVKK